jgi:hypothetical protein
MRKDEQLWRRRHVRSQAVALVPPQQSFRYKLLTVSGYLIASAIIALWMAYLPTLAADFLTQLNVLPQHVASSSINRLHKSDQLVTVRFADRWIAMGTAGQPAHAGKSAEQIPFGCEGAFSRLVKVGNFSARCVAALAAPTKLAATD